MTVVALTSEREGRTPGRVRAAVRGIASVVAWAVLAFVVALVVALVVVPRATGSVPLAVLSGSMEPSVPPGSVVVVRPVDPTELRIGDVITYQVRSGDPTVVTHRIVGVSSGGGEPTFRTKGDANGAIDPEPVRAVQVRGEVWYQVPLMGHVLDRADPVHHPFAVRLLGAALALWAASLIGGTLRDRRRVDSGLHAAGGSPWPPPAASERVVLGPLAPVDRASRGGWRS